MYRTIKIEMDLDVDEMRLLMDGLAVDSSRVEPLEMM